MSFGKEHPKVTVILPTYQAATTLEACLTSVSRQEYPNLELLILDNLSTDGTIEIAEHFADRHHWACAVSATDLGIYDAMNKGLTLATGEWLYFLGADDVLEPEAFVRVFALDATQDVDLVYGDVKLKSGQLFDGALSQVDISRRNLCHQSAFYRRHLFERFGGFDTRFPVWADWEFNWKCFGDPAVRRAWVPVVIAEYGDDGFSSKQNDETLLSERPRLLFKHFKGSLGPEEMHDLLWHLLPRYVEEKGTVHGILLMVKVGLFTRQLRRYIAVAVLWKLRSVFASSSDLRAG